jgi:hypothetical protein
MGGWCVVEAEAWVCRLQAAEPTKGVALAREAIEVGLRVAVPEPMPGTPVRPGTREMEDCCWEGIAWLSMVELVVFGEGVG